MCSSSRSASVMIAEGNNFLLVFLERFGFPLGGVLPAAAVSASISLCSNAIGASSSEGVESALGRQ